MALITAISKAISFKARK